MRGVCAQLFLFPRLQKGTRRCLPPAPSPRFPKLTSKTWSSAAPYLPFSAPAPEPLSPTVTPTGKSLPVSDHIPLSLGQSSAP